MPGPVPDETDCFVGDRSFLGADLAIQNWSIGGDVKSRTAAAIRATGPAAIVAWSAVSAGCYRYAPIEPQAQPALGTDVRVRLTDAGAVSLAPLIGNRVELVDGRLFSVADTSITLAVTATTGRLGEETPWRGEEVAIPRTMLSGFERRTLDRRKSWLVGGIALGVVAAVAIGFSVTGNGGGGKGGQSGSPK
jgi:hypothetical protein